MKIDREQVKQLALSYMYNGERNVYDACVRALLTWLDKNGYEVVKKSATREG